MIKPGATAALIDRLATDGFAVAEHFFDEALCRALAEEATTVEADQTAVDASIGRGHGRMMEPAIRRARIRWLDGTTAAQRAFLADAETLRLALNMALYLGLFSFEAQIAVTPTGGYYKQHLDSFRGSRNRLVSLVTYLNDAWLPEDGGYLRIWRPAAGSDQDECRLPPALDVAPRFGSVVLMLSEDVPHEVLPCLRQRASIAGWFHVNAPQRLATG